MGNEGSFSTGKREKKAEGIVCSQRSCCSEANTSLNLVTNYLAKISVEKPTTTLPTLTYTQLI